MALRYDFENEIVEIITTRGFERSLTSIAAKDGHLNILQLPEYKQNSNFTEMYEDLQRARKVVDIHTTTGEYNLFEHVLKKQLDIQPQEVIDRFRNFGTINLQRTTMRRQLKDDEPIYREDMFSSVRYSFVVPYKVRPNQESKRADGLIHKVTEIYF